MLVHLEDSNQPSGGILRIFGSRTFVPANFSISQLKLLKLSLDAGLRMDGIPALDLWDLVVEALHSSHNVAARKLVARRNPKQIHPYQNQDEETRYPS